MHAVSELSFTAVRDETGAVSTVTCSQGQKGELVKKEITNKRVSIESSARSVIHPFGGHLCKLPVRGLYRVTTMIILSGMMVNVR